MGDSYGRRQKPVATVEECKMRTEFSCFCKVIFLPIRNRNDSTAQVTTSTRRISLDRSERGRRNLVARRVGSGSIFCDLFSPSPYTLPPNFYPYNSSATLLECCRPQE